VKICFVLQNCRNTPHISIKSQLIFIHRARTVSRLFRRLLATPCSLSLSFSPQIYFNLCCKLKRIASIRARVHSPANVKRQLISFPSACTGASIAAVCVEVSYILSPCDVTDNCLDNFVAILHNFYYRECVSVTGVSL